MAYRAKPTKINIPQSVELSGLPTIEACLAPLSVSALGLPALLSPAVPVINPVPLFGKATLTSYKTNWAIAISKATAQYKLLS